MATQKKPCEFNTKSVKVVYLPANTTSPVQPLGQGLIRILKAHDTWYSMERIVNGMEENPQQREYHEVWKDYTSEDAITVTEKAMKATGPKQ